VATNAFWKAGWFHALCISLFFVLTQALIPAPFQSLENLLYDINSRIHTLPADPQIVRVQSDGLDNTGQYSPDDVATTIHFLAASGARQIALDLPLSEAHSTSLVDAVRAAGNVRLAINLQAAGASTTKDTPGNLKQAAIGHMHYAMSAEGIQQGTGLAQVDSALIMAAAGLGYLNITTDTDHVVRTVQLAMPYRNDVYPALALSLAAGMQHTSMRDIRINSIPTIELGSRNISLNDQMAVYPVYHQPPYPDYSMDAILNGQAPAALFRGKTVLIGSNTPAIRLAGGQQVSRTELHAQLLQNILHHEFISHPDWTNLLQFGLLLAVALYLLLALPRMRTAAALLTSSLIAVSMLATSIYLFHYQTVWLATASPVLLLIIGHLILSLTSHLSTSRQQQASILNQTHKMLADAFLQQGMPKQAWEKYRLCHMDDALAAQLSKLATSFERQQQFDMAAAIYRHILRTIPDDQDAQQRLVTAEAAMAEPAQTTSQGMDWLLDRKQQAYLGRYAILSELGKGAMGTVFLGQDPKINRNVAIKVLDLSKEFNSDELDEVKASFFHEAEIAGMLSHPNIVTIYDAGDEHELAYIAMEYLEGVTLIPYTDANHLLPVISTLRVVARVADALHYAHQQHVIHRDIKPANIMILKNSVVKVTDFGIAHIIEASKNRDGTVLGTPSYMSPEQLSGRMLDGRSDLFSLGVMLYELLSGSRPFQHASITGLMKKIVREPHADIRDLKPDIPASVAALIDRLLAKKSVDRFATADDAAKAINQCLHEINNPGDRP